jgi:hypothetical protein
MTLGKMGIDFDFASLKLLLKGTTAEVLLPGDGEKYEKSVERWSEHCIKRAVSQSPKRYQFVSTHHSTVLALLVPCFISAVSFPNFPYIDLSS